MRMIGSLDSAQHAEQFAAYLLTEGINNQVEEEGAVWEVWVKDEDDLKQSKALLEKFLANPDDKKYQDGIAKAKLIRKEKERKAREYQKKVHVGTTVGGAQSKSTPLTISLILLCGFVAVMTNFGKKRSDPILRAFAYNSVAPEKVVELFTQLGVDPNQVSADVLEKQEVRSASILSGQVWRLVTPIFIHHGEMHLVFNMIWLFQLGRLLEIRYGTLYLGLLILVVAVLSTFAQCAVPESIGGSMSYFQPGGYLLNGLGGMSGVVYGLFGFIWVKSSIDPTSRLFIPQSTVTIMLVWLVFCMTPLAEQFGLGNIANWAHGIGLLVGCVAGYVLTRPGKVAQR